MTVRPELLRQVQFVVAALALVGGLQLLFRGLRSYLHSGSLSSVGTSGIATLSAGLVRVTGTIEAPITIQSYHGFPCVYYRAEPRRENAQADDDSSATVERSIEFVQLGRQALSAGRARLGQYRCRAEATARRAPQSRRGGARRHEL